MEDLGIRGGSWIQLPMDTGGGLYTLRSSQYDVLRERQMKGNTRLTCAERR